MDKNNTEIVMTTEGFNNIKDKAVLERITVSNMLSIALKTWYETNKERLDNTENQLSLSRVNVRMDEETNAIYKLFVNDCTNNLLEHLTKN